MCINIKMLKVLVLDLNEIIWENGMKEKVIIMGGWEVLVFDVIRRNIELYIVY